MATSFEHFGDSQLSSEVIEAMSDILKTYKEDDLIDLLCECEMLLQTNDIYLRKINARGLFRLFNLITGIERKAKCRLLGNFQLLHSLTINIEKAILKRIADLTRLVTALQEKVNENDIFTQQCIKFLLQKVEDHKNSLAVMQKQLNILQWAQGNVRYYNKMKYSSVRKILQTASDLYIIIMGEDLNIINQNHLFETAMDDLQLTNVQISPTDFAKEIMQHTEYLPLYIRDELNYSDPACEISDYGRIICRTYEMTFDLQIQELAAAHGKEMDEFCLPAIETFVKQKAINAKNADVICEDLLKDIHNLHNRMLILRKKAQDAVIESQLSVLQSQNKNTGKSTRKLAIITEPSIWKYTSGKLVEKQLLESHMEKFSAGECKKINQEIVTFSPDMIVVTDTIYREIPNSKTIKLSFADFCCGYWIPEKNGHKFEKYIAICEFHHDYRISLYYIPDTGKIKKKTFLAPWHNFTDTLQERILHCSFFMDKNVDSHDIAIYRSFEDYKGDKSKKLDEIHSKRNDGKFVKLIHSHWRSALQDSSEQDRAVEILTRFAERL